MNNKFTFGPFFESKLSLHLESGIMGLTKGSAPKSGYGRVIITGFHVVNFGDLFNFGEITGFHVVIFANFPLIGQ